MSRPFGRNYAFIVAGAIFLALMGAAGLRAVPGVLMRSEPRPINL